VLVIFPVAVLKSQVDREQTTMPHSDPAKEAEWIVREIVDDYAQGLSCTERARFLNRIAELISERRAVRDEPSDQDTERIN